MTSLCLKWTICICHSLWLILSFPTVILAKEIKDVSEGRQQANPPLSPLERGEGNRQEKFLTNSKDDLTRNNINKCPQDIESLTNSLIKDLPDYANRVIQRNRHHSHPLEFFPFYVVTAGKAEFEPLPLPQNQYKPTLTLNDDQEIKQVFFTTLERQYPSNDRLLETQNFHWLMLTDTPDGWQMVMLWTRLGYPDHQTEANFISTPPLESSNGVIGQSVQLWLRDCGFSPQKRN